MRTVLLGLLILLALPLVNAADTGNVSPSSVHSLGNDCDSSTNVYSSDGSDAFCDKGKLQGFNSYSFSVPAGATIDGILVSFVNAHKEGTDKDSSSRVRLSWNNGSTWTSYKNFWLTSTSDYTHSNGSATDTWGRTWTSTEINSGFWLEWLNEERTGNEGKDYVDYLPVTIFYTEAASNDPPDWTNNLVVNSTTATDDDVLRFNATGTDPDADNYRMTVCDTNSITNGYPGTCNGGNTLCTSTATSSGSETACTLTLTDSHVGTLNAYAFLCDAGSSTCNTSTTTSITVSSNPPTVTGALADTPDPQNVSGLINFTLTASDPDTNNYWLTVCTTDAITENTNAAGTCTGGTLCTSSSFADDAQAWCTNTTVAALTGTNTGYGFACDSHGECSSSSSTSYTVESNPPAFTANLADSPDPVTVTEQLTFTATASDPEGDSYRLTVCKTNAITEGFPGSCAAGQTMCSSGSTSSGAEASCQNTTVVGDVGTFTAYGFLCDSWGECNLTSTSTSVTVESRVPYFSVGLADSPDPVSVGSNITYSATGTDPEADNYILSVCRTDAITDGYPGSCTGGSLCNSTATSSGVGASCEYNATESDDGTLTAYAFLCEAGSNLCNTTSTSATTTVHSLSPTWTVNLADTPDSLFAGATITYSGTASDPEGGNYYLTVCRTNSITNASPGTCVGGGNSLCTSSSAADDVEATCTYDTVVEDIGTLTAYGFVCDTKSECSASTSTTTTVTDPPLTITLLSPLNITYNGTTIYVNATADEAVSAWQYSLDGAANVSLSINTTVLFTVGQHEIVLWGNDSGDNWDSDTEYFRVLNMSYDTFDGSTTNFAAESNLSDVCPILEKTAYGRISWNSCFDVTSSDLDTHVDFVTGTAGINSSALSAWNVSANITLYRVNRTLPSIVNPDNTVCTHCTVLSYNSENVTFNVSYFSNYTVLENASLEIWDDTDSVTKYVNQQIRFFANYTNSTNNTITSATCQIGFNVSGGWTTPTSMTYNATSTLYEYNRSFTTGTTYNWNATCSHASYPTIELTDTVVVTGYPPVWSVNLSDSPDPVNASDTITYTGTGDDPDDANYRMTVCSSNSISAGYPGTCDSGATLCTSGATADTAQASCAYTTTIDDIGTLTAFGFLCDAAGECNTTSTNITTSVLDDLPNFLCTFRTSCTGSEVDVLRAENDSGGYYGGHVQLINYSGTTYDYTLCCESESGYELNATCSNSTTIPLLNASATTNAHVEYPNGTSYTNSICLGTTEGNFTCEYGVTECSGGYKPVLSLASSEGDNTTNAHVSNYSQYTNNICCRLNATIAGNTPPGAVTLIYPADGNTSVFERLVNLNWTTASPTEGDPVTYNLSLNTTGSCAVEHQETGIVDSNFTTNELCVDQVYNWTVQACDDDGCSAWATQFNFTIASTLGVTFLQNTSTFASLIPGQTNDTEAGPGAPMRIENSGNVLINVSLNATGALFTNAGLDNAAFQFKIAANESNAYGSALETYTNVPSSLVQAITNITYTDANDDALIHYRVTVPDNEPPGGKSTIITVRATVS